MARPARLAANTAKKRKDKRTKKWAEERKRRLAAKVTEPEESEKLRVEESVEERKKRRRRPPAETASTGSLKQSSKGEKEKKKKTRKKANPKHYRELLKRKAKEQIREGEWERKPFLKDVTTAKFISFMERLILLVTGEKPEWDWSINQFREEKESVVLVAEQNIETAPALLKLVEEDFSDMVEQWCSQHPITLEGRARNLHGYDQLTKYGQKLLKDNSMEFRRWYKHLFRKSYIEEEKRIQIERYQLNYEADHPESEKSQETIDYLVERMALHELEKLILNRLARLKKQLKTGQDVWPRDLGWWQNSSVASDKCKQFPFLEPVLIALGKASMNYKSSRDLAARYGIKSPEKRKVWALIDPKKIDTVLFDAGIKPKTFAKYRAALIKCGVLEKVYKIQNGPAILAIGMYSDIGTNRQRVSRFLQGKTVGRIHNFKLGKK